MENVAYSVTPVIKLSIPTCLVTYNPDVVVLQSYDNTLLNLVSYKLNIELHNKIIAVKV